MSSVNAFLESWSESHAAVFITGICITVITLLVSFRLWRFKRRAGDAARLLGSSKITFNAERFLREVAMVTGAVMLVLGVTFGAYSIIRAVFASGEVEHCYIDQDDGVVTLNGYREWRPDHELGVYESVQRAAQAARTIGCQLR